MSAAWRWQGSRSPQRGRPGVLHPDYAGRCPDGPDESGAHQRCGLVKRCGVRELRRAVREQRLYLPRDGKIYWRSASAGLEDEDLPEDLGSSDRYLEVPHKNDLDLGRRLALAFVNKELPDDADTVAAFFRRRGAYRRFKELLNARGMLQQWFDFESRATEKALRAWCEENGIQLVDG